MLPRFAELALGRQDDALDLIQRKNGKARRHAFEEIIDVAQASRYYARTAGVRRSLSRPGLVLAVTRAP